MIEIVNYKISWPEEFQKIAFQIKSLVGEHALAIHHIGSTSVPGLAAKDVIDIQMTTSDLNVPIAESLKKMGFFKSSHEQDHCPPGLFLSAVDLEKRHYRGTVRAAHLHIRKQGTFNQRYPILFRDFLRAHPMASDAYGEIKKQLSNYFPENVDAYYDIKDPVCDALLSGALVWAKSTDWKPGPSEI